MGLCWSRVQYPPKVPAVVFQACKWKKMSSGRSHCTAQGRLPKQPVEGGSSQPHTTEGTRGDLGVGGGGKAPSASQHKGKPLSASEWRNPSASPPSPQRGAALPVFRQLCSSGCSSPGLYPSSQQREWDLQQPEPSDLSTWP